MLLHRDVALDVPLCCCLDVSLCCCSGCVALLLHRDVALDVLCVDVALCRAEDNEPVVGQHRDDGQLPQRGVRRLDDVCELCLLDGVGGAQAREQPHPQALRAQPRVLVVNFLRICTIKRY